MMKKLSSWLFGGILAVLLVASAVTAYAAAEGEVETFEAIIPVKVTNSLDEKIKIEQLEGRTHLPETTEIKVGADGTGSFRISFADAYEGEIFKYRITEVPGAGKDAEGAGVKYNVREKTYICEVWVFFGNEDGTGPKYARAFLYESDVPLPPEELGTDDTDASVPKPVQCDFMNAIGPRLEGGDARSRDIYNKDQTGELIFKPGTGKITDVYLIDPITGNKVRMGEGTVPAYENGKVVGTYEITSITDSDGNTRVVVTFKPNKDYVGTPDPALVEVMDEYGLTAQGRYYPENFSGPIPINDETWGKRGEPQTGHPRFEEGSGKIVKIQFIDPYTGKPTDSKTVDALDQNGKKIGTYTLNDDGSVTFRPDPDFVGDPQPARLLGTDEHGFTAIAIYQPHVTDSENPPTPPPKTGDDFRILPYLFGMSASAALGAILLFARSRKKDKTK